MVVIWKVNYNVEFGGVLVEVGLLFSNYWANKLLYV